MESFSMNSSLAGNKVTIGSRQPRAAKVRYRVLLRIICIVWKSGLVAQVLLLSICCFWLRETGELPVLLIR